MQHFSWVPISIFRRCWHFSVGGASGRGGVDSRGRGMASEEFGPRSNSVAQTHQPQGGHTALFSASQQGETNGSNVIPIPSNAGARLSELFTCSDIFLQERSCFLLGGLIDSNHLLKHNRMSPPLLTLLGGHLLLSRMCVLVHKPTYTETSAASSVHLNSKYQI